MNRGPLVRIQQVFARMYADWDLTLPVANLEARKPGGILDPQGWVIVFRFGRLEAREYIEIFSTHRLGQDTLERIYEDGEVESLRGSCGNVFTADGPASLDEWAELIRQHHTDLLRELFARSTTPNSEEP